MVYKDNIIADHCKRHKRGRLFDGESRAHSGAARLREDHPRLAAHRISDDNDDDDDDVNFKIVLATA